MLYLGRDTAQALRVEGRQTVALDATASRNRHLSPPGTGAGVNGCSHCETPLLTREKISVSGSECLCSYPPTSDDSRGHRHSPVDRSLSVERNGAAPIIA